jgi:hypothetical protein
MAELWEWLSDVTKDVPNWVIILVCVFGGLTILKLLSEPRPPGHNLLQHIIRILFGGPALTVTETRAFALNIVPPEKVEQFLRKNPNAMDFDGFAEEVEDLEGDDKIAAKRLVRQAVAARRRHPDYGLYVTEEMIETVHRG